ncbi:MAG: site-specific integrase [Parasphingorhabdus sp.]|uniref:tyrosine-type recombinase/integrase n=1 Tax=Parasphingorhabdus sp. TaxID=2709688 RepID=UPI0030024B6C
MFSNGYSLPQDNAQNHLRIVSKKRSGSPRKTSIRLNGHVARRKPKAQETEYWDKDLPGFGLRVFPSGRKTWFVMLRQRKKQRRISLGQVGKVSADEARRHAKAELLKVALDGLSASGSSSAGKKKQSPLMRDYAHRFWADYARHWKPSTQSRNKTAIFRDICDAFGGHRVDELRKSDILFWRDGFAAKPGAFNRTLPVLAVMMTYAEQLGLRPRGSNPCKGTPRYKKTRMERFLTKREFGRLASTLLDFENTRPDAVSAIRLLIFTGARRGEIENLRWEWVQSPRLMLPDSKTGAKIIYLNKQALAVIHSIPNPKAKGLVFPAPYADAPINLGNFWPKIRNHAALPDVRLHDLRHSFASIAIADNISLMVIGKLLGHALAETTARYAHLSDEVVADAASRVSGSIAKCLGMAS